VASSGSTRKDGLPANDVMALAEGPDGVVWMGTLLESAGCFQEAGIRCSKI
jgi:hypothetical protein